MENDYKDWKAREQAYMNSGIYESVNLAGDDPNRFLHVSLLDPNMVAYTKNDEKGQADIQTRTTLKKYMHKFGLECMECAPSDSLDETSLEEMVKALDMEVEKGDPQAISNAWLAVKKIL